MHCYLDPLMIKDQESGMKHINDYKQNSLLLLHAHSHLSKSVFTFISVGINLKILKTALPLSPSRPTLFLHGCSLLYITFWKLLKEFYFVPMKEPGVYKENKQALGVGTKIKLEQKPKQLLQVKEPPWDWLMAVLWNFLQLPQLQFHLHKGNDGG